MIDQELREAISAHALTEYPKECCGLVVRGKYIPCRNVAADPFADVALAPEDFAAAEDIGPIEAFVHSHPGSTAEPTQADLTVCENGDAPSGSSLVSGFNQTAQSPLTIGASSARKATMPR